MIDVLEDVLAWWQAGATCAVATVVNIAGSAPCQPGDSLAVGPNHQVVGGVSGGCVEAAVYELADDVRGTGAPMLQSYSSDGSPYAPQLTCGGDIDVFVQQISRKIFPEFGSVVNDVRAGRAVAVATIVAGGQVGDRLIVRPRGVAGPLAGQRLADVVTADAHALLLAGQSATMQYGGPATAVFIDCYRPPPRMIVFGATVFAAAATRLGRRLGYQVTVCDARATFAIAQRFPDAAEVVVAWPHTYLATTSTDDRTVVCVMTHDTKFDVPLLEIALRRPLAYVGAMGSRAHNADRLRQLQARGLTEVELFRLRAPIGLDIGARTPEEVATAIGAEIIATRSGASGGALHLGSGPIHNRARCI